MEWDPTWEGCTLAMANVQPSIQRPEAPCCREVVLREGIRLSLPERPCCREVVLREGLRLSLPERPCCREVVLREDFRRHF